MAAKNPRVNTVLDPPLYQALEAMARRDRVSLSQKVRDLLMEAMELLEDEALDRLVRERRTEASKGRWVSQAEVKRRLGLS